MEEFKQGLREGEDIIRFGYIECSDILVKLVKLIIGIFTCHVNFH